jgi:hypothetical protein
MTGCPVRIRGQAPGDHRGSGEAGAPPGTGAAGRAGRPQRAPRAWTSIRSRRPTQWTCWPAQTGSTAPGPAGPIWQARSAARRCPRARRRHPPQRSAAQFWPDNERFTLVAATVRAAEFGCPGHATGLGYLVPLWASWALRTYIKAASRIRPAPTGSRQKPALITARKIGARDTEYLALLSLGIVRLRRGSCTQARGRPPARSRPVLRDRQPGI